MSALASRLLLCLVCLLLLPPAVEAEENPLDAIVARVDGVEISRRDVEGELSRLLPWSSYHGTVDEAKRQTLRRQAMQTVIDRQLKLADAQQRGVGVDKGELAEALAKVIAKYPDEAAFRAELAKGGFTVDAVKTELRNRRLLEIGERQVADPDRPVSRAEAQKYYQDNLAKFVEPKRAVVREIFIQVPILNRNDQMWNGYLNKAKDALARIESGEPFEEVVRAVSDAPAEEKEAGGLLGPLHAGRLPPAMDKVVWGLREGQVSNPVEDLKGIYLLKVDRFLPDHQVSFAEVETKLRKDLQRSWSEERVATWLKGLRAKAKIEILDPALAEPAGEAP